MKKELFSIFLEEHPWIFVLAGITAFIIPELDSARLWAVSWLAVLGLGLLAFGWIAAIVLYILDIRRIRNEE